MEPLNGLLQMVDGSRLLWSEADASIGNVTGSNSVNVFLGLGLQGTQQAENCCD